MLEWLYYDICVVIVLSIKYTVYHCTEVDLRQYGVQVGYK